MKAVGIVAEYNPFHNGHMFHIREAKNLSGCDSVVCVMSGNFVQRGEPAIFDKWKRAEMAVQGGVDLVVELPVVFSVRSAQYFASGSIRLLHSLGVVNHVCFGAESADLSLLKKTAAAIEEARVIEQMKTHLKTGCTYAAALGTALHTCYSIPLEFLEKPNNILAIEYLRAITTYAPELSPLVIHRKTAYHDKTIQNTIASATAIRLSILENEALIDEALKSLPPGSQEIIVQLLAQKRGPAVTTNLSDIVLAKLRTITPAFLASLPDVTEGLENKFISAAMQTGTLAELLSVLKSRRYTTTRLQRILIFALLGITRKEIQEFDNHGPQYIRILAFNQRGRQILREIRTRTQLPLITKVTHFAKSPQAGNLLETMLRYDILATDLYTLSLPGHKWKKGAWDFRHSPVYVE